MRKLYPMRFSLEDASFSRASQAYANDGRLALPGAPRIEQTDFGKVMMVEEGTTIQPSNALFSSGVSDWTFYTFAPLVATISSATGCNFGDKIARIVITTGTTIHSYCQFFKSIGTVTKGQKIACQIRVKSNIPFSGCRLNCSNNVSPFTSYGYVDPLNITTEWQTVKLIATASEDATARISFSCGNAPSGAIIDIDYMIAEVGKSYSTSPYDGTRQPESLTLPAAGLSPTEGTIEGIVEITDLTKTQKGNNSVNHIFCLQKSLDSDYGIGLYHHYNTPNWRLIIRGDNQVANTVDIYDALTPNGWYYYKVYWTTTIAKVEFWNLATRVKVAEGSTNNPNLPSGFKPNLYLGSQNDLWHYANTRFGRHRLSNVARTTDPDFSNLMPRDSNTTAIFDPTYSFLK